jgi:chromosome segregation ATPase
VKKKVAGDVFMILIQQLKDQAIMINKHRSETRGESCMANSDIFGEKFKMDFLISAPNNLLTEAKLEIQRLTSEVQRLNKEVKTLKEDETMHLEKIEELKKETTLLRKREDELKKEVEKIDNMFHKCKSTINLL